jgi:acetylornithine deacetylase/succinyl-diaminopimelate desuccinylase-like protein
MIETRSAVGNPLGTPPRGLITRRWAVLFTGCFFLFDALLALQIKAQTAPDISEELAIILEHLNTPELSAALDFVEAQQQGPADVIQDWIGVCNAYAPSQGGGLMGNEAYRSNYIYKMFRIYGLEQVYIDDDLNVVAVRPGTGGGPTVVLNAHHDNVALWPQDQPVEAFVRDGRIYCPAAGDDIIGVIQMFVILRAMNAAELETMGDVWFVALAGEETGSVPAERFARGNYPHNLDWRRGDAVVQLHGGAGEGVTTGSGPIINMSTLRFFTPFERNVTGQPGADRRWRPHAVDLLARAIPRIREEVSDPRADCLRCPQEEMDGAAEWYVNMAKIEASPIRNRPASEAAVMMDLRAANEPQMRQLHGRIMQIADEICEEYRTRGLPPQFYADRCSFVFRVDRVYGRDWDKDPIEGFNPADNSPARVVAAAGYALYGFPPIIDASRGCGDCQNMYRAGLPAFSFRGSVIDHGDGRFERGSLGRRGGHDVTENITIHSVWAGIKHGLVFAASYAGMPGIRGFADISAERSVAGRP